MELTKRLSWRTKADQFYQSFGCGQIHTIKYMGTCESCGRSVYSHGCSGEKPCGDLVEDSPDPRGAIPATHCMNLYHAREHGLSGRDVMTCYDCAQDGQKYRGIIAAAKSAGTWKPATLSTCDVCGGKLQPHEFAIGRHTWNCKAPQAEQNNCDGSGPHALGTVKVLPTGGDGNMILCRSCWLAEIRYRKERNRDLGDFAKFDLPTWESGKVYETGGEADGR